MLQSGVEETWTTLRVLEWTTRRFAEAGFDAPRLEAQVLLAHALGCDRVGLYTQFDKPLGPEELAAYRGSIRRRLDGEPAAYLVGAQEFWSLSFAVDPRVLIPRRDTETLVEVVLDEITDRAAALRLVDVATGAGSLAVTLAHELPSATVVATDLSAEALAVAADNAARHRVADRIELRQGDLLAPLGADERFEVAVANLPYVASGDLAGLSPEVGREPRSALDGGPDGLGPMRRFLAGIADHLVGDGLVVVEHGHDQAAAVAALFAATGRFAPARLRCDLAGRPRATYTRRAD